MIKKNNKITHSAVSIMLSVALAMSSANISGVEFTKSVSAASVNPVDTGNGYEYSTGRAIGMQMNAPYTGKSFPTETISNIIFDEYDLSNCQYDDWGGDDSINIEKKNMPDIIKMDMCYENHQ